jgi:hypothetical protein
MNLLYLITAYLPFLFAMNQSIENRYFSMISLIAQKMHLFNLNIRIVDWRDNNSHIDSSFTYIIIIMK